jgi:hypothetical protein
MAAPVYPDHDPLSNTVSSSKVLVLESTCSSVITLCAEIYFVNLRPTSRAVMNRFENAKFEFSRGQVLVKVYSPSRLSEEHKEIDRIEWYKLRSSGEM